VTELYSIKDVARIFGVQESRLRYWIQTGFIGASRRRGGRLYYTFQDLIAVKTALELTGAGLSVQTIRKNLEALAELLDGDPQPASRLRICSDGETLVAVDDDVVFEPSSGQVVMSFAVDNLRSRVAEVLEMPAQTRADTDGVPGGAVDDGPTEAHAPPTAYGYFTDGVKADERGDDDTALECYRRALDLEPSLAAAHTNTGNILARRGDLAGARRAFETALEYEPQQAEARFNLGNLLDDLGETEHAIAELRRVCRTHPDFADAHYNLGLLLARVGGVAQARSHIEQYLAIDADSEWATRGRDFLATL
jgi:tetratricopeptide (TPR) repeat protein